MHLEDVRWLLASPRLLCDVSLVDGPDPRFHFVDDHDMSWVVLKTMTYLGIGTTVEPELSWVPQEKFLHPHKKARRVAPTVAPSELCTNYDKTVLSVPLVDLTATESSACLSEEEDNP